MINYIFVISHNRANFLWIIKTITTTEKKRTTKFHLLNFSPSEWCLHAADGGRGHVSILSVSTLLHPSLFLSILSSTSSSTLFSAATFLGKCPNCQALRVVGLKGEGGSSAKEENINFSTTEFAQRELKVDNALLPVNPTS